MNAPLHLLMTAEPAAEPRQVPAGPAPTARVHAATDLTGGATTAQIVLQDMVYTLRITRAGKLILTK